MLFILSYFPVQFLGDSIQPVVPPFLSRRMTQEQLITHTSKLRQDNDAPLDKAEKEGDEAQAEKLRQHVFVGIGHMLEHYVRLFCNPKSEEEKLER